MCINVTTQKSLKSEMLLCKTVTYWLPIVETIDFHNHFLIVSTYLNSNGSW